MKIFQKLTTKEWVLGLLLHVYIGGFAYFWGASTNDMYLVIVFAFFVTQLLSGRITFNVILQEHWEYRIKNRYVRLFVNFGVNVLIANILMTLINKIYVGDLAEFLSGPVIYGLLFGCMYFAYFILNLKLSDQTVEMN